VVTDHRARRALAEVLSKATITAETLTHPDTWSPAAASIGETELNHEEAGPDGPWGERPVRTAWALAQMLIRSAVEHCRALQAVVAVEQSLLAQETLARGAMEAGASAFWLLDPRVGARRRVCRLQLLRIKSAMELERVTGQMRIANTAGEYGETPEIVRSYSLKLGIGSFRDQARDLSAICEDELRPGYTSRARALIDASGATGAYGIYSGTAHAELYAVMRRYKSSNSPSAAEQQTTLEAVDDPRGMAAAAQVAFISIVEPLQRVAILFGWTADKKPGSDLSDVIDVANTVFAPYLP
jgi:hypothetical protein